MSLIPRRVASPSHAGGARPRRCCRCATSSRSSRSAAGVFGRAVAYVQAVSGVSFDVTPRETLGAGGGVRLRQVDHRPAGAAADRAHVGHGAASRAATSRSVGRKELRTMRQRLQIVFQDPYASLNPRMTVEAAIGEPLGPPRHGQGSGRRPGARAAAPGRPVARARHAATPTSSPAASASASASPGPWPSSR